MKTLFSLLIVVILLNQSGYSQLPSSYPFKTVLDNEGYLYVTGDTFIQSNGTFDIIIKKFLNENMVWKRVIDNPNGDDKGMDICLDNNQTPIITGYHFDPITKYNDIVVIKCDKGNGSVTWMKSNVSRYDDKGLSIVADYSNKIYITGYITYQTQDKGLITIKYDPDGNKLWSRIYRNKDFKKEDVGMDIITDDNFVYILGYTYNGEHNGNDILLINYDLNGAKEEVDIFPTAGASETPTGFVIAGKGINDKSRIAITSVSDNSAIGGTGSSYLTLYYNGGTNMTLRWSKYFSRGTGENVATSIDADENRNVYVSGYSFSSTSDFDFATIKYIAENGEYGWTNNPIMFYDAVNGSDKASSVKVNADSVYVSGPSQNNPGGYRTIGYIQNNGQIDLSWEKVFVPLFDELREETNRASVINLDRNTGNLIVMAMAWDDYNKSNYAIQGYSGRGDLLYTIDYDSQHRDPTSQDRNIKKESTSNELIQNIPNPFNPSTSIKYNLNESSFIKIKVYDVLGNEVTELVNERVEAGSHAVRFDGSSLSSGVYYYTMSANGNVIETKRMILMK